MATGSYAYVLISSDSTVSSKTLYRWNFIGTRMSGVNSDVRNKIPKYATINSASVSLQIKRSGTSDSSTYNHDAAWDIRDSDGNVTTTVWSQSKAIKRSFTTFSQNVLSYINSNDVNAGVANSIYVLSFKASGTLSKDYTVNGNRIDIGFTYPTITIKGNVNNADYGEVKSVTHTLGSPIDIGTSSQWGSQICELIANPKSGYRFVKWSDGVTDRARDVRLAEDVLTSHSTVLTYTAEFEPIPKYTITVNAESGGSVSGGGMYEEGTTATITATPDSGYEFIQWNDGNTLNPRTITVSNNATYTAQFEQSVCAVTFRNQDGTIIKSYQVASGQALGEIPSVSRNGYTFAGWIPCAPARSTDDAIVDSYQYNGNNSFYALHQRYKYADKFALHIDAYMSDWIDIGNNNSGAQIISCTEGGGWGMGYMANTTGHGVEIHTGSYTGIDLGFGTANRFANNTWYSFDVVFANGTLEVFVDGVSKGTVTTPNASINYNDSNTIFVGAEAGNNLTAPGGSYFDGFISNVFIANQGTRLQPASTNTTIDQNTDYYPVWRLNTTHTITISADPNSSGVVSGGGIFEHDMTSVLTATPNTGYKFIQWSDGDTSNPRTVTVSEDISYTALFEILTYSIFTDASPIEGGVITGGGIHAYGSNITLTAVPNDGYKFIRWVDGVTDQSRNIQVDSNASYTAIFEKLTTNSIFKGIARQEVYRGSVKQDIYRYKENHLKHP